MAISQTQVQHFLEAYGAALTKGDVDFIARSWTTPALLADDTSTRIFQDCSEFRDFFTDMVAQYHARGLVETRVAINEFSVISKNLAAVRVGWQLLAKGDVENGLENHFYILRQHEPHYFTIDFSAPVSG